MTTPEEVDLLRRIADRCYRGWTPDLDEWVCDDGAEREPMLPDERAWSLARFEAE